VPPFPLSFPESFPSVAPVKRKIPPFSGGRPPLPSPGFSFDAKIGPSPPYFVVPLILRGKLSRPSLFSVPFSPHSSSFMLPCGWPTSFSSVRFVSGMQPLGAASPPSGQSTLSPPLFSLSPVVPLFPLVLFYFSGQVSLGINFLPPVPRVPFSPYADHFPPPPRRHFGEAVRTCIDPTC